MAGRTKKASTNYGKRNGREKGMEKVTRQQTHLLGSLVHLLFDNFELRVFGHLQGRCQWPG